MTKANEKLTGENQNLRAENKDYKLLQKSFGSKQVDNLLEQAKAVQQSKQLVYINLLTSDRLNEYLVSIDEQAEDMFFRLIKEYADRQRVTEQLKAENQFLWVQKINNIKACVREVVESESIYS